MVHSTWIVPFLHTLTLFQGVLTIRNVQLVVPPLVRAGSSANLLCLYDLENSNLYSVKWYRGQHEFYRFMPSENPPTKVFQIAGIYVDMYTSNEHQVTLHNVPTFIAGEVSCEITTDVPSISTACAAEMLHVQVMDIDINVRGSEFRPGEVLLGHCTASTPAKLAFYLNSYRVPTELVTQGSPTSATLNMTLFKEHFRPRGDLRIQCSGGIGDHYYISSRVVTLRRAAEPTLEDSSAGLSQSDLYLVIILILLCTI